jgi:hypothetical protein
MGSNKGSAMTTDQIKITFRVRRDEDEATALLKFLRRVNARHGVDANQEKAFDATSEQLRVALRGIVERE